MDDLMVGAGYAGYALSLIQTGILAEAGADIYKAVRQWLVTGAIAFNKPPLRNENLIFGTDCKFCGIIPGNTNKFLISRGEYRASKYVSYAFNQATGYHHKICGSPKFVEVEAGDLNMAMENYKNLLILGGPVANEYTKRICGYKDVIITGGGTTRTIPVFQSSSPIPYGFYCGDENGWSYWDGREVKVQRQDENGAMKELARYGIKDRAGAITEPPVDGNRLVGDMLMIIRVPNPTMPGGAHTIIGGMHGYSLETFFRDFAENTRQLGQMVGSREYFQALIPVRIEPDGTTKMDWDGWNNWRPKVEPLT